jgi:hypothetical protein
MVVLLGPQIADLDTRIKEIESNWQPRTKPTRSASAIQKTRLLHRLAKSYPCLLGLDCGPHLDQRSWHRVEKAGHLIAIDPPVRLLISRLHPRGRPHMQRPAFPTLCAAVATWCPMIARPPRPARLAAHQPHRRLPRGRRRQPWPRRIPATSGHHCPLAHGQGGSSMIMFFFRAANRAILPFCGVTPTS